MRATAKKPRFTNKPQSRAKVAAELAASVEYAGVRPGYKKFGTSLPVETHEKLRLAALKRSVTIQELLIEYADSLISREELEAYQTFVSDLKSTR